MSEPRADIVLSVTDLRIVLDPSGIDIDDDVSFAIHQGEVLGLVGESASGKTTAATSLLAYQRRGAKTINFGILYGMGPFALAGQLGVSQGEAKEFIAAYFRRFPKIKGCLDGILEEARATGRTRTIFGRERPIPGLADRNHAVRSNAERMAMNAPFQGSAADLIKKAMVDLEGRLAEAIPSARLLLQVHDELVLECDEADAPAVGALASGTMAGAARLAVPLTVDVGTGRNWAEAK